MGFASPKFPPSVIALTAALGLMMAVLDNTIVNVALIPIANHFHAPLGKVQWIVTIYFLAQAAVIPAAGYFSDRFGRKRLYTSCLVAFVAASALCGLAHHENALILFRALQGLAGGALLPLAQAIAYSGYSGADRARASSLVAVPILLAPAFGPSLGGYLVDAFGWQTIFLVNVPLGLLAITASVWILPRDSESDAKSPPFDYLGLALCVGGVVAIVYAFSIVGHRPGPGLAPRPWTAPDVLAFGVSGMALTGIFAVHALRRKHPVLDLTAFRSYGFAIGSASAWMISAVFFGSVFLLPVFFQEIREEKMTAFAAGLAMMPMGLAAAVGTTLCGLLYKRTGARPLAVVGALLMLWSSWELARIPPDADGWTLLPWLVVRGLSFGLVFLSVQTLTLQKIPAGDLAQASSLYSATRQVASSLGLAILVSSLAEQTARAEASGSAQAAYLGFQQAFHVVTLGCVLLVALVCFLPAREKVLPASAVT